MNWKNGTPSTFGRKDAWRLRACLCALALGSIALRAQTAPFLELKFHNNSSTSLVNTGTAGTSVSLAAPNPVFSSNSPIGGGAYALDFGATGGTSAVDALTGEVLNAAKNLKSFTIMGWINCRSGSVSPGGNRLVSWYQFLNNGHGVDLAMTSTGALSLGVNSWNDFSGAASNSGKITVDANSSYNNWRFFAVTYDETLASGHVKFYFGTATSQAELDRSVSYDKGIAGAQIAASVTIGNHSTAARNGSTHAMFKGLMDEIRVYGSKVNSDGALSLSAIQSLQGAAPLAGQPGLKYERWNNINGTTIASLTSSPDYATTPDQTSVITTSDVPKNLADNYGIRVSGWIEAPETGDYLFGLTSDDAGELRLSTNSSPVNKQVIASVATWKSYDVWGDTSNPIPLQAGQVYYIEALMKEGTGGDHLKIGWKRPSTASIQTIVAPALHVSPPLMDALYPSAYHLYEPGTGTKKATMGWHKETGNDHYYIEAEGYKGLKVQNGSLVVPDILQFGGKFPDAPDQNDLLFRWERPDADNPGVLHMETQGGEELFRVGGGQAAGQNFVEFQDEIVLDGDASQIPNPGGSNGWLTVYTSLHFFNGLQTTREYLNVARLHTFTGQYDGIDLSMQTRNGLIAAGVRHGVDSMDLSASRITFWGGIEEEDPSQDSAILDRRGLRLFTAASPGVFGPGTTVTPLYIETPEIHAMDVVTTPRWRIPDYVFEENYSPRSLEDMEVYVKKHKHLPDIPSAKEIARKGLSQGEMNVGMLKTVEEITLHLIEMKKELDSQKLETKRLREELKASKAGKAGRTK